MRGAVIFNSLAVFFFRIKPDFFFELQDLRKSPLKKNLTGSEKIALKSLLLTDLESPDRFQMHYFKGKTEGNVQHTSKISPAAR